MLQDTCYRTHVTENTLQVTRYSTFATGNTLQDSLYQTEATKHNGQDTRDRSNTTRHRTEKMLLDPSYKKHAIGQLAQLVKALALLPKGPGFEPNLALTHITCLLSPQLAI